MRWLMLLVIRLSLTCVALYSAYTIRLYAVINFGMVIHEFDPWFNYRATEYLAKHGSDKFFKWFDHESWYPLGRPVGTTIYPGMQFVSVWIHKLLEFAGQPMSINDVCVLVPAWFGVVATIFCGLLTYECYRSVDAAVLATVVMAIIPAHIMRSVAGGFDNECVAIPALCATFYFWCLSLRGPRWWPAAVICGLSYFWMVASWGGYIFVLNMIGLHATILSLWKFNDFSFTLYNSYTLFYIVGTALAIQVPVVGLTPLRSLEQIGPLGMFGVMQILAACEIYRRRNAKMSDDAFMQFRVKVFVVAGACGAVVAALLFQMGYFGPLSARIRGLFVQHTRTGNPLVDSVAEHQATSPLAYWQYLHYTCYLAPLGFVLTFPEQTDSKSFLTWYAIVAYYFSARMNRLLLLMGPICSALAGIALSGLCHWSWQQMPDTFSIEALLGEDERPLARPAPPEKEVEPAKTAKNAPKAKAGANGKAKNSAGQAAAPRRQVKRTPLPPGLLGEVIEPFMEAYDEMVVPRRMGAFFFMIILLLYSRSFYTYCFRVGEAMSNPSIMLKSRQADGSYVIIDDYREAYWWLRDNTPENARVMAWWDYGYQIAGVGKRTTIADGNTWNHEHIATLGRCLTQPEKKAWNITRHLADYVLVWTGGGGDDLAKSPHMARIANSVYPDICPGDPTCSKFGFDQHGLPTDMMKSSLLYKLHSHNTTSVNAARLGESTRVNELNVQANSKYFKEVYYSRYGKVRIWKVLNISEESKAWVADTSNRRCDAPGSWYCIGDYPPDLRWLIEKRKNFKQLEDFNRGKGDEEDEAYQKAYHEALSGK